MTANTSALGFVLAVMAAATPATAQTAAPAGAAACSGCHAASVMAGAAVPPIHGRPANDIVTAMQEFRAGTRPATVMDRLAKGFSEDETRAIATWLAAQR